MTAKELIEKVIYKAHQGNAKVMVAPARGYAHYPLKPNDQVPEDNDDQTIFIHISDLL
jgi:hypothetical protein